MSSSFNTSRKTSDIRVKNCCFFSSKWIWALPPPLTVTFHVITFLFLLLFYLQMWHLQPKATLMLWSEWVNWPVRVKDPKIWVSDCSHLVTSPVFRLSLSLSVCLFVWWRLASVTPASLTSSISSSYTDVIQHQLPVQGKLWEGRVWVDAGGVFF